MSTRSPPPQSGSLTSLLDVMFIMMFAALVNAGARGQPDEAEAAPAATASASASASASPADAGAPEHKPPPSAAFEAARRRALDDLARAAADRTAIVARVSGDGVLRALDRGGEVVELGTPLLEKVPDPDLAVAYLGDRAAELRICALVARNLGAADLHDHLVVIVPDEPVRDLVVDLHEGLERDARRCLEEQGGLAVLVDPSLVKEVVP